MDQELKQNLKEKQTWLRGLYMVLFSVCYGVAKVVLFAVVVFQFLLVLFTSKTNPRLLKLGQSLSTYAYQILVYLTFNSNYQPYPFGAWPKGEPTIKEKSGEAEPGSE